MTSPRERASQSKRRSRGWSDDMDSQAISRRLAIVEQLYSTWLTLKGARTTAPPSATGNTLPATATIASETHGPTPIPHDREITS